ncbi:MAG: zinc metalloprotease HtpX [Candidatus Bathyarchaeota archaeon]|nr:zinc metalloprotease HtpX [Candidatus Bathyarchaeota archaeon]
MNLIKLRLSMLGTLALIIGVSTIGMATLLAYSGGLNVYSLATMVILFNAAQWLLAPYLVNALYRVRKLDPIENPWLHSTFEDLSTRSGIKTPKLMISKMRIPNAFAYGSPLTGNHVAITEGLLTSLEGEEVEAVLAHELGHIKHRDVQVTMLISVLPSLFYIISRSTMFARYGKRDQRNGGGLALVGGLSMLLYLGLMLFNLRFSRLREYYADQHAAGIVSDGARKLTEGLAKITTSTARHRIFTPRTRGSSSFKTLFISDPDRAVNDVAELNSASIGRSDEELVANIASRKITGIARFAELFSTHPNIVKRIRALTN